MDNGALKKLLTKTKADQKPVNCAIAQGDGKTTASCLILLDRVNAPKAVENGQAKALKGTGFSKIQILGEDSFELESGEYQEEQALAQPASGARVHRCRRRQQASAYRRAA